MFPTRSDAVSDAPAPQGQPAPSSVLKGPKVSLRPLTEADLPIRARWTADDELCALMGVDVKAEPFVSADEELRRNRDWFARRMLQGALLLAVEAEGRCIGDLDITLSPGDRLAELSLFIGDRAAWGKGYGTETVELIAAWLFGHEETPIEKLTADVAAGNERALRFWEKVGFKEYYTDENGTRYLQREKG